MKLNELFTQLRQLNISMWLEEDRLRLKAPKGSLSPELRETITEHRDEIIAFLRKAIEARDTTLPPLQPIPRNGAIPLSFDQQRLWFIDHLEDGAIAYNIFNPIHIQSELRVEILERTLREIVRRHEILRTTFGESDGYPVQIIADQGDVQVPVIDLRHLMSHCREQHMWDITLGEARRSFDLIKGPLFRVTLLHLGTNDWMLLLNMHHIISDGWSMQVFLQEFMVLYDAFTSNQPSPLPDLTIQYADFAIWQRQWLQGDTLEKQLNYWKEQLRDATTLLALPTDRPRPAIQTFNGDRRSVSVPTAHTQLLEKLARDTEASMFMAVMAAYQYLLFRYSYQRDIIVGTPITNRYRPELEALIGFLVNTIAIRTRFDQPMSFRDLLIQVHETTVGAYVHQHIPLDRVIDILQLERSLSYNPLFQVMLTLDVAQASKETPPTTVTTDIQTIAFDNNTAQFDLSLDLAHTSDGLQGSFNFNTDLFDASTIDRMAQHLALLIEQITHDPDVLLGNLSLLTESERIQLLRLGQRRVPYDQTATLATLCIDQIHRTPDAIALIFENQFFSYSAIDCKTDRIADMLRYHRIGPDSLVAVCLERTPDLVLGVLAVLKAGGAYIPVDPNYPAERITWLLDDSKPTVVLTHTTLRGILSSAQDVTIHCLDELPDPPTVVLERTYRTVPANLSHIIYTSGSTGIPKGVAITHRSVVAFLCWAQEVFDSSARQGILASTSLNFDLSVFELFLPLAYGGTIILARNALALPEILDAHAVTLINTVPSAMQELVRQNALPPSVKTVNLAGEALPGALVTQIYAMGHVQAVYNLYGPSEDTTYSTGACIPPDAVKPSIGQPIANTQAYVLDPQGQLTLTGVIGELCLGGMGLARGYWQRPQLTAATFVPDAFGPHPGSRLYHTGDQVRWRSNSELDYLGRRDTQIKLRGYRIELGEIETCLTQHERVQECVVIVHARSSGNQQLVAYIVSVAAQSQETTPLSQVLQRDLSTQLPAYMIPSVFVELASFPLTPNGKVDRRALPYPETYQKEIATDALPRTPVEQQLIAIWQDVLGVAAIGIHENFFVLGGDSIISMQVVSRATQQGLHIMPRQIFQYPTVATLAQVVGKHNAIVAEQGVVTGIVPITPIQWWLLRQPSATRHHFNQSVLLTVPPTFTETHAQTVFQALLHHHDALRLVFTETATGWQQTHTSVDARPSVTIVNLIDTDPERVSDMITAHSETTQAGFNLAGGLLVAAVYFNCGSEPGRLLLAIHHLVIDGVSWRILLEDIQILWSQLSQKQPLQLPPKTTAFKTWVERLTDYATSPSLLEERSYWTNIMEAEVGSIPFDGVRQDATFATMQDVVTILDAESTQLLLQEVPPIYNTQINDILLTALARALTEWCGGEAVHIELEGHGRVDLFDDVDISRTVGWFTTKYPVLLQNRHSDIGAHVCAIKEQLRRIPYQGIGYGLLYDAAPEQEPVASSNAPVEVVFNYLGQFDQTLEEESAFDIATESSGANVSLQMPLLHLLTITGQIINQQLLMNWSFSSSVHVQSTIEHVAELFMTALRDIIEHCTTVDIGQYTPSDFALTSLSQPQLDHVLEMVCGQHSHVAKTIIEDIYPLAPMQQGMLFHALYEPEDDVYFEQLHATFGPDFVPHDFTAAWQAAIKRHAILRTGFVWEGLDQPLQFVYRECSIPVTMLDWRDEPEETLTARFEEWLLANRQQGFQLHRAPLMSLTLIQFDNSTIRVVLSFHHILLDGWSLSLLFKEVLMDYATLAQGIPLDVVAPPPYSEYIAWLQKQDMHEAETFWRTYLSGITNPTAMLFPARVASDPVEDEIICDTDLKLSTDIYELARHLRVTVNTVIQGAWAVILSAYSSNNEVLFGTTVAGRPPDLFGVEQMIGLFINTLPLRTYLAPSESIALWLQQLLKQQVEARRYDYATLTSIQNWSGVSSGVALFESLVVFENYPVENVSQESAETETQQIEIRERTNYPLTLVAIPGSTIVLRLQYANGICDRTIAQRIMNQLLYVLQQFTNTPNQSLAQLSLLTSLEREQVLSAWNHTVNTQAPLMTLATAFATQCERTPDASALVHDDGTLSYAALAHQVGQLAHLLQEHGVSPDTPIAVLLPRGIEMVVAQLSIMVAGGAYVPLSPQLPANRIVFILDDTQAPLLITTHALQASLSHTQTKIVLFDALDRERTSYPIHPPSCVTQPEHLAYIIYTSGSTGQPKGVGVSHRSLLNLVAWHQRVYEVTATDRTTQLAGLGFDAAAWEVWPYLVSGSTLLLPTALVHEDLPRLLEWLARENITMTFLSTPLLEAALTLGWKGHEQLRLVLTGGDRLHTSPTNESTFTLINNYGPTENTVVATWTPVVPDELGMPPIGRPVDRVELYVLDSRRQPVGAGVPGELHIGGASLARGYWKRPDLTAAAFVPDNVSGSPGALLYRSGDHVYWRDDAQLMFLGRMDVQVKVRGYRIELGEIEAAMQQHPDVHEAAVVTYSSAGGNQLAGYVTPATVDAEAVRIYIGEQLPDYMVPQLLIAQEAIPLTANGKIDRQKLQNQAQQSTTQQMLYVTPRTEIEQTLSAIWGSVLGIDQVGIHDNFFALGGDSILSIQIIARASQHNLALTPRDVFEHPTIADLATVVGQGKKVLAEQGPVTGTVPLLPIQQWFFKQSLPERHHFNQSVLLTVPPTISYNTLTQLVPALMQHHDVLRTRFIGTVTDDWTQLIDAPSDTHLPLTVIDIQHLTASEQTDAILNECTIAQETLNLSDGPLLRLVYFNNGPTELGRLFIVIHHVVVDGVSWRILLEDLQLIFQQISQNQPVQLPPKTTSFKMWSERLQEWELSDQLAQEKSYWEALVSAPIPPLPLDYDTPRHEAIAATAESISVELSVSETLSLLQNVPPVYNTQINDVLLTALAQTLTVLYENDRIRIDMEGHGRVDAFDDIDLSRTVGWFTAKYPVLLNLHGLEDVGAQLCAVKEQLRQIPHQGVGYGALRWYDSEDTDVLEPSVPIEVIFNYLGQFDQTFDDSQLFGSAPEATGPAEAETTPLTHLLNISGFISEGQLVVNWLFSPDHHETSTIAWLADMFIQNLQNIVEHCTAPDVGKYTPSDFSLARMKPAELDNLCMQVCGDAGPLAKTVIEDIYPLSPLQQGMLFHNLATPETGAYIEQLSVVLTTQLDMHRLVQAWQRVLDRHTILRTAFVWQAMSEPLQVVFRRVELPVTILDWRDISEAERASQLIEWHDADHTQGIDLNKAPLLRITMIRLTEDTYQFVWTYHHALLDGWSVPILLQEVFTYYEQLGQEEAFPETTIRPYRDYIAWLQRQDTKAAEAFWRHNLAGFTTPVLVSDIFQPYQPDVADNAAEAHVTLSTSITTDLQNIAQRYQVTLNTLVQSMWALILSRYSGTSDVLFGVTVAGRPTEIRDIDRMLGLFINTLPFRVQLSPSMPLHEWFQTIQANQLAIQRYEYTPLTSAHKWSEIAPDVPLFECLLVFENYPVASTAETLEGKAESPDIQTIDKTNYPLVLTGIPGDDLVLRIQYDNQRIAPDAIEQMIRRLHHIATQFIANAPQRIGDISLLTAAEHYQLIHDWNATTMEYPGGTGIHQSIVAQATQHPDSIALVYESCQITFHALYTQATALSTHLRASGVQTEVPVGLCIERSPDLVICMLAVWLAGGAYVPLDPDYPAERIATIVHEGRLPVLLSQRSLQSLFPTSMATVLWVDELLPISVIASSRVLATVSHPDTTAYILYTSGSTGKPKGVQIPHRSIENHMHWMQQYFPLSRMDRVFQKTPFGFDASVWEFLAPLLTGAQLVLAQPGGHRDPWYLVQALRDHQITTLQLVPSLLEALLTGPGLTDCDSLRQVFCGGEALRTMVAEMFTEQVGVPLYNLYGPTETTIDATWCQYEKHMLGATVPIGRPIANLQAYVLDKGQQPTVVGVPGELYMGGTGVARGYLRAADQTAERFVPDHLSRVVGGRLYRTGDMVQWESGGTLMFVGRRDDQVKLRGYRVELEEVAAVLQRQAGVAQSVVVVQENTTRVQQLVAYIVPVEGGMWTASLERQIQSALQELLPSYMVPTAYVGLSALPLTPNGKIDRKALPSATRNLKDASDNYIMPRTPTEQTLALIWADILEVDRIGIYDNFFTLGGNSLLVIQLQGRIHSKFDRLIPIIKLMRSTTIEHVAAMLSVDQDIQSWPIAVPLNEAGSLPPLFLVSPGAWYATQYYQLSDYLGEDQPVYVLQPPDPSWEQEPYPSMEEIAQAYVTTLQTIQPEGPYYLGGWSFGGGVALEIAQQLLQQDQSVELITVIDTFFTVDLKPYDSIDVFQMYTRLLDVEIDFDYMRTLSYANQLTYYINQIIDPTTTEVEIEQIRRVFNTMRATSFAGEQYRPQKYDGRILFFRATQPDEDRPDVDPVKRWSQLCDSLEVHDLDGRHQDILADPHVKELAKKLKKALRDAKDSQLKQKRGFFARFRREHAQ
ncbi:MAG: amino acid adenylation domain-containing protein [Blastochloris sp.]|nr:amino acid adenylation domain-containing protein [Blastochloris sp.]